MKIEEIDLKLYKKAIEAMTTSYAPYSNFNVGSALLSESGEIISGCNVENTSYGLTVCAERVAVFKAVSQGIQKFNTIAIANSDEINSPPCGACLQVLYEFAPELLVIYPDGAGALMKKKIVDMLPFGFHR